MQDGMTFKEYVSNEKRKWKNMNGKQKWDYYKSYYLVPTIVILVIFVIVVDILLQTVILKKDILMSGTVYNHYTELEDEAIDSFQEGYLNYIGANKKKEKAYIGYDYITEDDYNSIMILQTTVAAGTLDFLIVDKTSFDYLLNQTVYGDISQYLDTATMEKYKSKIIEAKDEETKTIYPAAIDISDTEYAKKYLGGEDAYLVFIINTPHPDQMQGLLEFFESGQLE